MRRLWSRARHGAEWPLPVLLNFTPWPARDPEYLTQLERYFAVMRTIAVLTTLALFPFLDALNVTGMYVTLAFVAAYNAFIVLYVLRRHQRWLAGGYLGYSLDVVAASAAVSQTGGVASPAFVSYYPLAVFYAFRFGRSQLANILVTTVSCYGLAAAVSGQALIEVWGVIAFRMFWLVLSAWWAVLMVERARSAEDALNIELRRTRALLQAAHAPATSLTVDGVLAAVLQQSLQLTESDVAAVRLDGREGHSRVYRAQLDETPGAVAFGRMVRANARARQVLLGSGSPLTPADVATRVGGLPPELGEFSSICAAGIPGDHGRLGVVAVARRGPPPMATVHLQALSAFLERAALAVQNARLYAQLQAQMEELRFLHGQIVRTERLAAIGELAAKVAHEINNPLASIHMYNSLLFEHPADPEEQRRLAGSVQEQVERAKSIVRDILDYSRPHESHPEVIDLNVAVDRGLGLVRHAANAGRVAIIEQYSDSLPPVLADRGQLSQVLVNLASNAIDAMAEGGELTISTGLDEGEVYVRLSDDGPGIAPEHMARIFEPFFSTKPAGRGTGLGLAVCRTLVAQHHGRISVETELGKGTTFTVWLPPARIPEDMVAGSRTR